MPLQPLTFSPILARALFFSEGFMNTKTFTVNRRHMNAQVVETTADTGLARRATTGDQHAFAELFDAHFTFVRQVARNLGIPDGEIDDVAQESFVVAFRQIHRFTHGKFTTWIYRITSNLVANRHRSRKLRDTFFGAFSKQNTKRVVQPDEALEQAQENALVGSLLAAMGHKKREVFALYELEGLSGEEIAERLHCKIETVWSRLHYARAEFETLAKKRGLT